MDNFGGQLGSTLLALSFVGVLAWVSLSLLKRLQQRSQGGNFLGRSKVVEGEMRFVRALPLGAKERVVVVHYHGEELLLGVTAGGISLLASSELPVAAQPPADNHAG